MGRLLVVTGPPGAGKSTVAEELADRFDPSALVAGDAFFAFVRRGLVPPWLPEAHDQNDTVLAAAGAAAGRLANGAPTVVYDGVVGPWFLPAFLAATGLPALHYVVLLPSQEVCLDRVAKRIGHGFTDAQAALHMHREFVRAADAMDARFVLRDPPPDARRTADVIGQRFGAGDLLHEG